MASGSWADYRPDYRDIHGAKNILTKEKYGKFEDFEVNKVKYLRIA